MISRQFKRVSDYRTAESLPSCSRRETQVDHLPATAAGYFSHKKHRSSFWPSRNTAELPARCDKATCCSVSGHDVVKCTSSVKLRHIKTSNISRLQHRAEFRVKVCFIGTPMERRT